MKQLLRIATCVSVALLSVTAVSIASRCAFAQDALFAQEESVVKMKMQLAGSVMGPAVKGAAYSGEEVNSSTQVLPDGTRIHHENRTTVYRDSEGRVRRETPDQITIMDPVAGVSYFLNPKTMTAQKAPVMLNYVVRHSRGEGTAGAIVRTDSTFTMTTSRGGETSVVINGAPVDPKLIAEAIAKAKEHGEAVTLTGEKVTGEKVDGEKVTGEKMVMDKMVLDKVTAEGMAAEKVGMGFATRLDTRGKSEDLGKTTMEGVTAEGTRTTSTIETGLIGNDRPIQIVTERWYSPDLQTVLSTKTSDPRMGEISFQLTGVRRGDPGAYLFQVPAGYTVGERK